MAGARLWFHPWSERVRSSHAEGRHVILFAASNLAGTPYRKAPASQPPNDWRDDLAWGLGAMGAVAALTLLNVWGSHWLSTAWAKQRSAEAREMLARLGAGAISAYERDGTLCASVGPVPAEVPRGRHYQPTPQDRTAFACLRISLPARQYYQYTYTRKADGFVITVRGDLDGDGVLSEFSRSGRFGSAGRLLLVEDTKFDAELE